MGVQIMVIIGVCVVVILAIGAFLASLYKRVEGKGEALVITRTSGRTDAVTTGAIVLPKIHRVERMDITRKRITIRREGRKGSSGEEYEGLHCKDNIRADLKVDFYIGVNPNPEDIIKVAEQFTCAGASDLKRLEEHFAPKFSEALKTVIKEFEFSALYTERNQFKERIKEMLATDLDGFVLKDVSIDKIEQTPLDAHDPNNVLDAVGIRKIASITSAQNIETSEIRETEATQTKQKQVSGETARLQLERTLEEETERTNREIENVKINERNNILIMREQARLEAEKVRLQTDQEIAVQAENVNREVEVARINNEKVVEIQREHVTRAREVERVNTERQVVEQELNKQKFVESENRDIADIVAVRTKTERNIAQEEEATNDLRVKHQAERQKLVTVTEASAQADAEAIKKTTIASANLEVVKREAEQDIVKADTTLKTAERESEAKQKIAAAVRVEKAAPGLAEADVRERLAEVASKEVVVEAARVRDVGVAEAEARVQQANATEVEGKAQAVAIREKGLAEAEGSKAQYEAMGSIAPEVREHEIQKLNIEKSRDVEIAAIEANATVATKNAEVMSAAMAKADIKVIGGGDVFDQVRNAMVNSQALDARFDNSEVLSSVIAKYKSGEKDFAQDVKEILQSSEVSTGDVGTLMLAKTLAGLAGKDGNGLQGLIDLVNGSKK